MLVLCQFSYTYLDPMAGHEMTGRDACVIEAEHSSEVGDAFMTALMGLLAPNVCPNRFPAYPQSFKLVSYRPETYGPDCAGAW